VISDSQFIISSFLELNLDQFLLIHREDTYFFRFQSHSLILLAFLNCWIAHQYAKRYSTSKRSLRLILGLRDRDTPVIS